MRRPGAWIVPVILLAGCAGVEESTGPDAPICGQWGLHHFGPEASDPDAHVAVVDCYAADQLRAYTVDASDARAGADRIELYTTDDYLRPASSDIERFIFVAFVLEGGALVPALSVGGNEGLQTAGYSRAHTGSLVRGMPDRFSVPVGDDGMARFAVGCDGPMTLNYVVANDQVNDRAAPLRPHYMPAVDGHGYAAFLGHAKDLPIGSVPPVPAGVPPTVTYEVGPVRVAVQHMDIPGVMRGTTTMEWEAGAGWTHVHCSHEGEVQNAAWSYRGDLHGERREASGLIASTPVTGAVDAVSRASLFQLGGGDGPASMRFEVEHELSMGLFWNTGCDGFHLGTTLEALFGLPAGTRWAPTDGLV